MENLKHTKGEFRRSPCGERGLKSPLESLASNDNESLPVRGAWIEMAWVMGSAWVTDCRSPCGERGLKYQQGNRDCLPARSLPVRGAWIEIEVYAKLLRNKYRSLPVRGAWIEIKAV